jgi:hypothetical protein
VGGGFGVQGQKLHLQVPGGPGAKLQRLPLPGGLVGPLALHLDGGVEGGNLLLYPQKALEGGLEVLAVKAHRGLFADGALGV